MMESQKNTNIMSHIDETKIKEEAEKSLLRCRPGDWNHAKRVVSWIEKLGENRSDLFILKTAGYIHDIGWRDVLNKESITLDELLIHEEEANTNSPLFVRAFLEGFQFQEEDILKILRLVHAADTYISIEEDEEIIVDADSLSKLTIDHVREKYQKSEWQRMYDLWKEELPNRVKTQKAKELYPSLLAQLHSSIEAQND